MLQRLWRECFNLGNMDDRDAIFNDQDSNHKAERSLITVAVLSAIFIVIEFTGGILAQSLAIMTDAAHMLSDLLSFIISIVAIRLARSQANYRFSFGYFRAEILGAAISIVIIWVLTSLLVLLAIQRVINDDYNIDADTMIVTAAAGIVFNIIMGLVLRYFRSAHPKMNHSHHKSSDVNINIQAAFIHVLGDFVQSIGVLTAAIIIRVTGWKLADPICTFLFSVIVLITSVTVIRDVFIILMEGTPTNVSYCELQKDLLNIGGVRTLHSLHVWSLNGDTTSASVHLAIDEPEKATETLKAASNVMRFKHGIPIVTIQVEPYERYMVSCKFCKPLLEVNSRVDI
ncbi:unnamed protein product [Thelazia callipaeda]|uniref:Zinc transporter 2 n=1 Tax=Thelazia callipaeda TaxID=103827 RepID=A0A0N5D8C4_THECL|nr:unnamed protein product [Thelazia callipaeda]